MDTVLIKKKLYEQAEVYQRLKNGDTTQVCYQEFQDKEWGMRDSHYINRMRMAYYLLYAGIDDEPVVVYLYQEELKDRKSNSFQGIGDCLNVLTVLLQRYNNNGKYNSLIEQAHNANFDCACGFNQDIPMNENLDTLDLIDGIYLMQELEYKDVMEVLVDEWKKSIADWTDNDRMTLIKFNTFLGKEQANEAIYKEVLESVVRNGRVFDRVSAYNKVIQYYIKAAKCDLAFTYLKQLIVMTDFEEIRRIRLFGDVLEECFEIICGYDQVADSVWTWAKPYLKEVTNWYGNLYTKAIAAARCVGDPYVKRLEKEYVEWKKEVGLS